MEELQHDCPSYRYNFHSDSGQKVPYVVLIPVKKNHDKVSKLTDTFLSKSVSTHAFTLV